MCDTTKCRINDIENMKNIFQQTVNGVKPKSLFRINKCIEIDEIKNVIRIKRVIGLPRQQQCEDISLLNRQCHLVGFGKAVLGMAVQLETILGNRLKAGILSIPFGTVDKFQSDKDMQLSSNTVVSVYEGAKDNLPDEHAVETAKKILCFVRKLKRNDILFVLISGGGSALLPLPSDPITLQEKTDLIKLLASCGANINEINCVRTQLSDTKGGKLALAAENCSKVISLIISDVIGDLVSVISSAPTVVRSDHDLQPMQVIEKYGITEKIPISIKTMLQKTSPNKSENPMNCSNIIIGNNKMATDIAINEFKKLGFVAICLSTEIDGNVKELSENYTKLALSIHNLKCKVICPAEFKIFFDKLNELFKFNSNVYNQIIEAADKNSPLCLIGSGEPTVYITGSGIGGRNQELALRVSKQMSEVKQLENCLFLSAGTDGIDGPTSAAGAIGCADIIKSGHNIDEFIKNNDSYNFYKNYKNGKYHIITGHTGTNVMDIHFLIIQ